MTKQHWITPINNNLLNVINNHYTINQSLIWKDNDHQVVVKGDDVFYKIYQKNDDNSYQLASHVRDIIGEIYRDQYSLKWDVQTIQTQTGYYQISERQVLNVCGTDCSFECLYQSYKKIHNEIEKRLNLDKVAKQLRLSIPRLKKVKLLRDVYNKQEDYGTDGSGQVFLLDDSDWILVLVSDEDQWMSIPFDFYEVFINGTQFTFCPLIWDKIAKGEESIEECNELVNKWTLIEGSISNIDLMSVKNKLQSLQSKMLNDNLNILLH